ncbi:MAG: preprotein translocase subunit SecE [Phycisphaerae bacterium]|nr:preprotein translocase subunit SecE [Phycisphaerae bacterium]
MSDAVEGAGGRDRPFEDRGPARSGQQPAGREAKRGFFDIYKSGQGSHTRLGTAMSTLALVCWLAYFLYQKLELVSENPSTAKLLQVGVSVAVIAVFGLLGYWLLALNRTVCDFLIATEGEMKKVSWTTRKDIIGSTKVVVFVVIALAILLFVVDLFFITFFNSIGVLKGAGILEALRELF